MSARPSSAAIRIGVLLGGLLGSVSCAPEQATLPAPSRPPLVAVSVYPLECFAKRMLGDAVPVACPMPPGLDPASWQPSRDALRRMNDASLVFLNGAGLEGWAARASLPPSRTVDTTARFRAELLGQARSTHSHGLGGEHTHGGRDPHVWMDPAWARRQATEIHDALLAEFPARGEAIGAGLAEVEAELAELTRRYRALAGRLEGQPLLASHASYDYLSRRFGWSVTNLELDASASLDAAAARQIEDALESAQAKIVLWTTRPAPATVATLEREYGLTSVLFDPGANPLQGTRDSIGDWFAIQRGNLDRLRAVLDDL